MPTNLISIGRSGAAAAKASIELTAQNIANASNPDYVRRSLQLTEFVGVARIDFQSSSSLAGVRIGGIERPNSELIQRRARDSASDLARAEAELTGLRDAETALEQSGLFRGLVDFEAALRVLEGDPTDQALRAGALESARQLAQTFQLADFSLGNARQLVEDDVNVGVDRINGAASEVARINLELANARDGTAAQASLLDARDAALREISSEFGIIARFDEFGAAEVRLVGTPSPAGEEGLLLVEGGKFSELSAQIDPQGTASFNFGGAPFAPLSGAMAGRASALTDLSGRQSSLDAIAGQTIAQANAAQASGAALDGSAGQPLFSGSDAGTIELALASGEDLALAPAGSPPASRDTANLSNALDALGADDGPIASVDRLLLSLSSRISGIETTREGLAIINSSAQADLLSETGVDLDAEAASLIRLQQAFEANSRVIQVASELFDTILGLN
ncbi:flagellar hook-associated protein 1 [Erythrobacter sp. NAP1]|uniref:flagellar hook-associated protein FlgK n=1 Tax=Erythrobacter sp. NAP1 TaxID=237727 RepID=UPI000068797D|nr:flagellar hook-associated protein FlgK [Erythrobacter sp. NAP1]EAQ28884.1 flagellar hook-associated protein 1 [Erythrobacter sp. NAP1]